ncbi:tRNA-U20a,U20b-dihydrouridine synthase [Lachnotalea glycerini]|uniref:tRNA-dihydrouridine synthase n=1 Tax=Lachnotalea glycerini TaxID=1763509 RepID=A0A318EUW1_9FIRM|nr:tRNA-dihydrouridine synthase family protein [Lachnotalea glycerini]PXV89123.1 tRNA-U20a,U20b-dihydrouridine synthase [Lachnotalea glycerini]
MNFYFAPMEGLTGYIYRNAHNTFFNSKINKYFAPFIQANQSESFKARELNDLLPEHNEGISVVPQILTNRAKDFIHTSKKLKALGYKEINLNLGCPSKTVVTKNRGSGFLEKTKELDEFLEEIFTSFISEISIKTRIGIENEEEFYELLDIYNKYPIKELIIHPRLQQDFYQNKPNLAIFEYALNNSTNPVCYNGDICKVKDYCDLQQRFHNLDTIMIGRGLLANPALVHEITANNRLDKNVLKQFHDKIYFDYQEILSGDRNVLFKMKELWFYMITIFTDNEKYTKKIKKSQKLSDYEDAVSRLFQEQELKNEWVSKD